MFVNTKKARNGFGDLLLGFILGLVAAGIAAVLGVKITPGWILIPAGISLIFAATSAAKHQFADGKQFVVGALGFALGAAAIVLIGV